MYSVSPQFFINTPLDVVVGQLFGARVQLVVSFPRIYRTRHMFSLIAAKDKVGIVLEHDESSKVVSV